MSLFAIADLHLSFSVPEKTMQIFSGWEDYHQRIEKNWRRLVSENDTVVLAGDSSWGMSLTQALPDFRFINSLPGTKILIKGNHDYWWATKKKMEDFFAAESLDTIKILHNNFYDYDGKYAVCGTRGWVNMPGETPEKDTKVLFREVQRLETSIKAALDSELEPLVFLHYPPMFANNYNYDILQVLYRYKIKRCFYGHVHSRSGHNLCCQGIYDDIDFRLIAGDYLQFIPQRIL